MILLALAGCDQKPIVSPVLVLDPSPAMAHQIGHLDAAGPALVAVPGEKGFLTFGPYAELAPGLYRVVFDLSITGAGGVAGRVDVNAFTTSQPEGLVESTSIGNGSDQKVSLDFTARAGARYEFRVISNGTATMRLLGIIVKRRQ